MPLAVTHVILAIIAVDLYRDYITKHKKYFTLWAILVAGISGLLPDIDIPLNFVLSEFGMVTHLLEHGGITHTPFFALLFLIPFAVLWSMKKHRLAILLIVVSFGILFHTFLDFFIGGGDIEGMMLFYPFSEQRVSQLGLLLFAGFPAIPALDALILLLWLFHEERKHKIRDVI
jgi:membrane-bound metal-dependent hydrolase YbcI (DUF457 family)